MGSADLGCPTAVLHVTSTGCSSWLLSQAGPEEAEPGVIWALSTPMESSEVSPRFLGTSIRMLLTELPAQNKSQAYKLFDESLSASA